MTPRMRARLLWLLAGLAIAYSIANSVLFYVVEAFGATWFTSTLVVYSFIFVAVMFLAFVDRGEVAVSGPGGSSVLRRDVVYRTPTGLVERVDHATSDGVQRGYYALTTRGVHAAHDVGARLDGLPAVAAGFDPTTAVDAALQRRAQTAAPDANPKVNP